jgi:hypothetical protein
LTSPSAKPGGALFFLAERRSILFASGSNVIHDMRFRAGNVRSVEGAIRIGFVFETHSLGQERVEQPVSGTRISPAAFPDVSIDLAELFG